MVYIHICTHTDTLYIRLFVSLVPLLGNGIDAYYWELDGEKERTQVKPAGTLVIKAASSEVESLHPLLKKVKMAWKLPKERSLLALLPKSQPVQLWLDDYCHHRLVDKYI